MADSKVKLLAHSLSTELKGSTIIASMNKILADSDTGGLQVLKHGDAARMAMDMYKEYVSDTDYTYFVNFVKQLDDLILKFRGNQPLNLDENDEDDEEDDPRPRKKGKNKGRYGGKPVKRIAAPPVDDSEDDSPAEDNSVVISSVLDTIRTNARKVASKKYGAKTG
jgi:hypothetical protein